MQNYIIIDLFELSVAADYNDYRLAFVVLASTWCQIFINSNVDMSYSQLCALLEISPVFVQIQHQVEANPAEMNLLSL